MMRFLKKGLVLLLCCWVWLGSFSCAVGPARTTAEGYAKTGDEVTWDYLEVILGQINPPEFPDREFYVTAFGAVGDGKTLDTEAIRAAIQACYQAGGGMVVVPEGAFLTGAIHLKSNVNLHLREGAILKFSQNPDDYLPLVFTRWEGTELYNYSPFIYAYAQENIAISGNGTLDGQADAENWWYWKGQWSRRTWEIVPQNQENSRALLQQMAEDGVPVDERIFGPGHYLRPSFIQFYKCRNILIDGVTIINSPMWIIHPVLSENITIQNVTVNSHGPNNDGCNPESSRNVLIQDSYFNTGDDCIAIKSGRNADGRRLAVPSENIVVRRCTMRAGHGGVVMGSEISGSVRNVFVEDCIMDSPNLQRIIRFKTNSVRGGVIENIFVRNVHVGEVRRAILYIDFDYEEGDVGQFTPIIRNINLENITSQQSERALFIRAYERSPVKGIHLRNCHFKGVQRDNVIEHVENLTLEEVYINGEPMVNPTRAN
ncbi:MAG TPA: glycoside hydrolase family 28 protein [Bacteroidales bacterium]|nr:glycoside hydrolase family 28 protein [Bacteroidales bacterium]